MIPLRLVIDTNVIVSAALKPDGLQRTVLLLAITRPASLYVTEAILAEYKEVLARPELRIRKGLRQQLLQLIKSHSQLVRVASPLKIAADPGDDKFVECADAACVRKDRASANKFLLLSILNYHIKANRLRSIVTSFVEQHITRPDNLWGEIAKFSREEWMAKFHEYKLHRYLKAHERVWRIATDIVNQYEGNALKILTGASVEEIYKRLDKLRVGEQISHMVVGALCDTKWIDGAGADVKADRHLKRVIGRVFRGAPTIAADTAQLTRTMEPNNPWLLDKPLFDIGQQRCHPKKPTCNECYTQRHKQLRIA